MDLASKPKDTLAPAQPSAPKPSYPSFTLRDDVATEFAEAYPDCKVGDELTAKVKLKVTSKSDDQYGNSVGFEIVTLDDVTKGGEAEDEDESEEADEEKTLGFKRPVVAKESPDIKASDLAY